MMYFQNKDDEELYCEKDWKLEDYLEDKLLKEEPEEEVNGPNPCSSLEFLGEVRDLDNTQVNETQLKRKNRKQSMNNIRSESQDTADLSKKSLHLHQMKEEDCPNKSLQKRIRKSKSLFEYRERKKGELKDAINTIFVLQKDLKEKEAIIEELQTIKHQMAENLQQKDCIIAQLIRSKNYEELAPVE